MGNANSAVSADSADSGQNLALRLAEALQDQTLRCSTLSRVASNVGAVGIEFTRYSLAGPGDEPWGCYRESGMRERTRADCLTVH